MPIEIKLPWQEEHQGDPGEHIVLFPRAAPASYLILFCLAVGFSAAL